MVPNLWGHKSRVRQIVSRKPLKRGEETDLWPTEILVHIGDSRGQRILVSVRYGERQWIEAARERERERLECCSLHQEEAAAVVVVDGPARVFVSANPYLHRDRKRCCFRWGLVCLRCPLTFRLKSSHKDSSLWSLTCLCWLSKASAFHDLQIIFYDDRMGVAFAYNSSLQRTLRWSLWRKWAKK